MFSDEILEKIFSQPEMKDIPIGYQAIIIRVIESVLEDYVEYVDELQPLHIHFAGKISIK